MNELSSVPTDELEYTLEAAVREAVDDSTFNKVNSCSYSASNKNVTNNLLNNTGSSLDSQLFLFSSPLLSFILSLFLYLFLSFFLMCQFSPDYLPCLLPYSFFLQDSEQFLTLVGCFSDFGCPLEALLLARQFSSFFCHSQYLRLKYFHQHPVLKQHKTMFSGSYAVLSL